MNHPIIYCVHSTTRFVFIHLVCNCFLQTLLKLTNIVDSPDALRGANVYQIKDTMAYVIVNEQDLTNAERVFEETIHSRSENDDT